jgi:hypothetical protein
MLKANLQKSNKTSKSIKKRLKLTKTIQKLLKMTKIGQNLKTEIPLKPKPTMFEFAKLPER